jgi:hypothetical protein
MPMVMPRSIRWETEIYIFGAALKAPGKNQITGSPPLRRAVDDPVKASMIVIKVARAPIKIKAIAGLLSRLAQLHLQELRRQGL